MTTRITYLAIILLAAVIPFAGCSKQAETTSQPIEDAGKEPAAHDPLDIPLTDAEIQALKQGLASYEDALGKIGSYRDSIRSALAAGDLHKTHRPLDELDLVLEHLPTVARDNDVPKSQWETVNTSAQQLRELFNEIHVRIDAGEESNYEAVAAEIDTAISRLQAVQMAMATSADQERGL